MNIKIYILEIKYLIFNYMTNNYILPISVALIIIIIIHYILENNIIIVNN